MVTVLHNIMDIPKGTHDYSGRPADFKSFLVLHFKSSRIRDVPENPQAIGEMSCILQLLTARHFTHF